MNDIGGFGSRSTNQKVVRLDVSVDEVLLVDCLDSRELLKSVLKRITEVVKTNHLLCYHNNSLR
jgi:PII-like signaling protein